MNSLVKKLENIDVDNLFDIKEAERNRLTEDNLLYTVFYSSSIEGNSLDQDKAKALINNKFVKQSGRFTDYIELVNHTDVYEYLLDLKTTKDITTNDVLTLHSKLFNGLIRNYEGFRVGLSAVSAYVADLENIPENIDKMLKELDTDENKSNLGALLAATYFHAKFVHLHPFEDGNGRMSRMLFNNHMLKNGFPPLLITQQDKTMYFKSLAAYDGTGYMLGFAGVVLSMYYRNESNELLHLLSKGDVQSDPVIKTLYNTVLIADGSENKEEVSKDINLLYKDSSELSKMSALWLMFMANMSIDSIIKDSLQSKNNNLECLSILIVDRLSMKSKESFEEYYPLVKDIAISKKADEARDLAVYTLAKKNNSYLTRKMILSIQNNNLNEHNVLQMLNALRTNSEYKDYVDIVKPLAKDASLNIRKLASQVLINDPNPSNIITNFDGFEHMEDAIKSFTIKEICRVRYDNDFMINSDEIARWLSKTILNIDGGYGTDCLLNDLSMIKNVNPIYLTKIGEMLKSDNIDDAKKAYSVYLLGKHKGYEFINSEYSMKIDDKQPEIINLAIFLSKINSNEPDIQEIFDMKENNIKLVGFLELSRIIESNKFGKDFLLMCKEKLAMWK